MYGIIYLVYCEHNSKIYVGQTTRTLKERITSHYGGSCKKKTSSFHNSLRKYPRETFVWRVIDFANSREELNFLERFYICIFDSHKKDIGYNLTLGGKGMLPNEETRQKMSEWQKGRKLSEETKEKLKNRKNGMTGKKHTEETKIKMRGAIRKRKENKTGFKGKDHPLYGKSMSYESKQKMSQAHKNKYACNDTYKKQTLDHLDKAQKCAWVSRKRKVYCYELDKLFDSLQDAANFFNTSLSNICRACTKDRHIYGKYHFYYYSSDLNCLITKEGSIIDKNSIDFSSKKVNKGKSLKKVKNLLYGVEYNSAREAALVTKDKEYTIQAHCRNEVKNPKWVYVLD